MPQTLTKQKAIEILETHVPNKNLQRHCLAVGYTLGAFYDYYKSLGIDVGNLTKEDWEIIGTLHDADWEKTATTPEQHTLMLIEWLKDYEVSEEMLDVFRSHNTKLTNLKDPQTLLEWTLECCDELTGFIVAVTLMRPNKLLAEVEVENVLKKFKTKEFARAVHREQISQCEEKLNIKLEDFIKITLDVMKENHQTLGL